MIGFRKYLTMFAAIGVAALTAIAASNTAIADGFNRYVEVQNQSNSPIIRLSGGGQTFMGSGQLLPGQSQQIHFDDGRGTCVFTIRADFADGTSENQRIDVCTVTRYTFY